MVARLEGEVVVRRHDNGAVEVVEAPPRARMSLSFLTACDPAVVKVSGNTVTLAGQVTYRIVGWDGLSSALLADLHEDRRPR